MTCLCPTPDENRNVITFKIQKRKDKLVALAHIMYAYLSFILLSKRKDQYLLRRKVV